MALEFKSATDVGEEYLTELKLLKPEFNTKQVDNDWWIRSRVLGGAMAGLYADQRLVSNDAFPQRSRRDSLERWLDLYLERGFNGATQAQGSAKISGTPGSTLTAGAQMLYTPNGNAYTTQEDVTLTAATGSVPVISVGSGQNQNLLAGAALTISSPPSGIDAAAEVLEAISDGRNAETESEASAAVVRRIRQPLSVGRDSDYEQYAKEANPAVVSSKVLRYPFGLGTVGVFITSGTTDIDQAIDNGEDISIIPSDQLVEEVQAYLQQNKPTTDCVTVFKPAELPIDVTVYVRYAAGGHDTIIAGQTLTQKELVQREVRRALYKTPVGGRRLGALGYVVASDIEETIDVMLSGEPVTVGSVPILLDRQVADLSATGVNRRVLASEAIVPGTINVVTF